MHDLHVWTIGSGSHALSAHLLVDPDRLMQSPQILERLRAMVRERYGIGHVTVQLECEHCDPGGIVICRPGKKRAAPFPKCRRVMGPMESQTVVLSLARTPFGRLNGALASLDATTLGAAALVGAMQRAGIDPSDVEHVTLGEVLPSRRRTESGATSTL